MDAGTCRSCGAGILWVRTTAGKAMPVEVAPRTVITSDGKTVIGHESHFAHCPNAGQHRRKSK